MSEASYTHGDKIDLDFLSPIKSTELTVQSILLTILFDFVEVVRIDRMVDQVEHVQLWSILSTAQLFLSTSTKSTTWSRFCHQCVQGLSE